MYELFSESTQYFAQPHIMFAMLPGALHLHEGNVPIL